MILNRRQLLEQDLKEKKPSNRRMAFLDMLLTARDDNNEPLSDKDIREEVDSTLPVLYRLRDRKKEADRRAFVSCHQRSCSRATYVCTHVSGATGSTDAGPPASHRPLCPLVV